MRGQITTAPTKRTALSVTVIVAAAIAWLAPFDLAVDAATRGVPELRALLIAALAISGAWFASSAGLRLERHGPNNLLVGLAAALGVAVYVAVLDAVLFRTVLPAGYAHLVREPLSLRLPYYMARAFNENVVYRLFLFSALVWAIARIRGAPPSMPMLVAAMVAVQFVNFAINAIGPDPQGFEAMRLFYDALRYLLPGAVWAWLYWRNGFTIAEVGSVGCHVFLQPLLTVLF